MESIATQPVSNYNRSIKGRGVYMVCVGEFSINWQGRLKGAEGGGGVVNQVAGGFTGWGGGGGQ